MVRKGAKAMHFIDEPLEEGATVDAQLDWTRRFDHMQQHSGERMDRVPHGRTGWDNLMCV